MKPTAHCKTFGKRGVLKDEDKTRILLEQRNRCFYCGLSFDDAFCIKGRLYLVRPVWDHFTPFSYCFNDHVDNFVAACSVCNGIKSDKIFDSIEQVVKHVRERRTKKGFPLSELWKTHPVAEEVAEVLFNELQERTLLEESQGCENLSDERLEQRLADLKLLRKLGNKFLKK